MNNYKNTTRKSQIATKKMKSLANFFITKFSDGIIEEFDIFPL